MNIEDQTWRAEAACKNTDGAVFFPKLPPGPRKSVDRQDHAEALAICAGCPVTEPCLEYALRNYEPGVWGNTTANERRKMRANRRVS